MFIVYQNIYFHSLDVILYMYMNEYSKCFKMLNFSFFQIIFRIINTSYYI